MRNPQCRKVKRGKKKKTKKMQPNKTSGDVVIVTKEYELRECIKRIAEYCKSDAVDCLNQVLREKNTSDPSCSAITTFNRFNEYLLFDKLFNEKDDEEDVFGLVKAIGYSNSDIELWKKKIDEERIRNECSSQ